MDKPIEIIKMLIEIVGTGRFFQGMRLAEIA